MALSPHPIADRYPMMGDDEYASLRASISTRGVLVPIVLYEGKILDGRNRYRVCIELGIDPPSEVFEGSEEQALVLSDAFNLERRHLTREQKRVIIEYRIRANPTRSSRAIADEVGVSPHTVIAVRQALNAPGVQIAHPVPVPPRVIGQDGRSYAAVARRTPPPPRPKSQAVHKVCERELEVLAERLEEGITRLRRIHANDLQAGTRACKELLGELRGTLGEICEMVDSRTPVGANAGDAGGR